MSISISDFGSGAKLYTLENAAGTRLVLTDIGAAMVSLIYKGTDVLLGWDDPARYLDGSGCLGAVVGRSANRISGAAFKLNGETYTLAKNNGENNLHSGPDGYHRRIWQTAETGENTVTFLMDSPDGDQGFPGHLCLYAKYVLTDTDAVELTLSGTPEADTPINMTNHAYFNLNGHDSGDILSHTLHISAGRYTPNGPDLIPLGEIRDVSGTPFDFRTAHTVGRDIGAEDPGLKSAGGYDLNFVADGTGLRTAALLRGDNTGITLTLSTDQPGVQLYTGNSLHGGSGKNGAVYAPYTGLCLETQQYPNAINQPAFPSCVVRGGETYRSRTVWQLGQE